MKYLIIGTGPAGVTAAEELRRLDASAEISMLGDEPEPPYSRMAIPYLIKNTITENGTYMRISEAHFADQKIEVIHAKVSSIKPAEKQVVLSDSETLEYDKLLIASGGTPLTPPIEGINLPGVHPCWTLENARDIMARAVPESHIVLIGAGFISTTIVEALVERGGTLTIIEMEDRLIPRMMDSKGADIIQKWCQNKGVNILTSARVQSIAQVNHKLAVSFAGHDAIEADLVISATGVKPNTEFLDGVDINVDHGVVVDEYLMSSDPNIYAAGDVAQAPDLLTQEKTVMAIQPVAAEHGKLVAHNMAKGNSLQWRGSINMNVLDMLGLVSCSFGLWEGIEGGDSAELHKPEQNKYIQLQFDEDRLIGASSVGYTEHVGIFQGLIQGKVALGEWKQKLIADPNQVMKAWIGVTQGVA